MCGICGKISYNGPPVEKDLITKMCRSISCRGPDDEGVYIGYRTKGQGKKVHAGLGHKRLAVIDLSHAGHQPMSNEDGTIWLTYNGEIYNFKGLRADLEKKGHVFRSNSDTEVILHFYEEEGVQSLQRYNGMFAFGLWDEKLSRLWLCRDRLGIKPVVYYWDGRHFVFASEIKALLQDPNVPKELDQDALMLYLSFSYVPAPYTIFKGIKKLEPGHFLVLENEKLTIMRYWDIPNAVDAEVSSLPFSEQERFYKESLYQGISEAVADRMIADVPLGAFLSGGIDSSIIVALMAQHTKEPVRTFSIGFKDAKLFDETDYAKDVAGLYNTKHHEFKITHKDMLDVFPEVLSVFDEPFSDSSAIPTYIVSRETRNQVTVALSGDGGDELFAGYRSYLGEYWYDTYMIIPALLREGLIEKMIKTFPDYRDNIVMEYARRLKRFIKGTKGSFAQRLLARKEIISQDTQNRLLLMLRNRDMSQKNISLAFLEDILAAHEGDRINKILYSDVKYSLPGDMLTKVDWMSMRNSLEVRVPFLDHRVVELAFKMKSSLKLRNGRGKYILKKTFKDLLPASLYDRPKVGFEVPISRWLKTDLKFLIEQYLSEDRIRNQGLFDYDVVKHLVEKHAAHISDTSWMLWNLIVFQYWYDHYIQ